MLQQGIEKKDVTVGTQLAKVDIRNAQKALGQKWIDLVITHIFWWMMASPDHEWQFVEEQEEKKPSTQASFSQLKLAWVR